MNFTATTSMPIPHGVSTQLGDIFAGVRHALGEHVFASLVDAYIAGKSNITLLVEQFPAYLRDRAPHIEYRNFLVQLATLEQALYDMRCDDDDAGDHLRLLRFDYPVSDYLRAIEHVIEAGDDEVVGAPVATRQCWVAVYRHGKQTGRMTISPNQFNNVLDWLTQRQPDSVLAVSALN